MNEPDLSVLCMRRVGWGPDDYRRWSARLLADGLGVVTPTEVAGETVTRICVLNPRTTADGCRRHPRYHGLMAQPESQAAPGRVLVMKFGGTSVADADKIRRVAARLVAAHLAGRRVVGVVSAMGHTTDQLVELAEQVSPAPAPARDGHAALDGGADHRRAVRHGDHRPRPPGGVADRARRRAS